MGARNDTLVLSFLAEYLSNARVTLTTEIASPSVPNPKHIPKHKLEMSYLPSNKVVIVMKR